MKPASANMITHLAGRQLSLACCLKVSPLSGSPLGFTEHDADIAFDLGDGDGEITYQSGLGFRRSSISHESDLSIPTMDLSGLLGAGGLELADIRAHLYDGASVQVFLVNWRDLTMGSIPLLSGFFGAITPHDDGFRAEIQGLADALSRGEILRTWQNLCPYDLGDSFCTKSLAGLVYPGTVSGVTSRSEFVAAAFAAGPVATDSTYIDGGKLTWLTGANAGRVVEVRTYTDGSKTFELPIPMPYAIQVGDTFSQLPGCTKKARGAGSCKERFNNLINFGGEPDVPQGDTLRLNPNAAPGGGYSAGS
jgi:uncharacterized phage protein (TIGR02218 family)